MFRRMVGLVCLMAGLAAIVASSVCGSPASSVGVAGLRSLTALRALRPLQPRSHVEIASEERGQRRSRLPRQSTIWQRSWTGSRKRALQGFGACQSIRVDAAKATCRLSRGQNAAERPGNRGQKHRPCFSTSPAGNPGLGDGSFGKAPPTSTPCRPRCAAHWPGSVVSSGRCGATDAAATFVLTLLRLGWSAQSARHLTTHDGTKIDLLAVAPKTVGFWVDQASLLWSDSSAHSNQSKGPLFWEAIRPLLVSGKLEGWSHWHRNVLVKLVSRGIWTQERLVRLRSEVDGSCQLCNDGPGTMFHRCYECPALQTERDMYVSQEVLPGFLAQSAPRWALGGAHFHGRLLVRQRHVAARRLGSGGGRRCGKPQSSSLRGGAERRFAWAVSGRDGEDYAAAMAGQFTLDPLTLYIDCEGTIATINGPKHKALGA